MDKYTKPYKKVQYHTKKIEQTHTNLQ